MLCSAVSLTILIFFFCVCVCDRSTCSYLPHMAPPADRNGFGPEAFLHRRFSRVGRSELCESAWNIQGLCREWMWELNGSLFIIHRFEWVFVCLTHGCRGRGWVALAFAPKPPEVWPLICTVCNSPGECGLRRDGIGPPSRTVWGRRPRCSLHKQISVLSRIHASVFFRAFVDANMMKKRRQQVFHQLGGFSQQGAVSSILGKEVLHKTFLQNGQLVVKCYKL